ncbi:MAG: hypothetical protein JW917_08640 [Ignavibacteria bacterium]|nr:hypothetical protein [Ignavibacteria bacterium]
MERRLPEFLRSLPLPPPKGDRNLPLPPPKGDIRVSVFDKVIGKSAKSLNSILELTPDSRRKNIFTDKFPATKFLILIFILVLNSFLFNLQHLLFLSILLIIISIFSILILHQGNKFSYLPKFYKKILIPVFLFGFLLSLPASLNFITPGREIFKIFGFGEARQLWIYYIPQNISFTAEGLEVTARITLRVFNAVCSTFFFFYLTSFEDFLFGLQKLKVPYSVVLIFSMFRVYLLLFLRTVQNYYFTLKSRLITQPDNAEIREFTGNRALNLFRLSTSEYKNISLAMKSRGYKI